MIIFAEAKLQSESNELIENEAIECGKIKLKFKEHTNHIYDTLKHKTIEDISKLYKVSDELASVVQMRFQDQAQLGIPAYKLFQGMSFKQINHQTVERNKQYTSDHVFIISALYGLINLTEYISSYRMDFKTKALVNTSLYKFWHDALENYIREHIKPKYILELTSSEYTKVIEQIAELKTKLVYVEFTTKTEKKVPSSNLKKYRGQILNYLIENELTDYNQLSKFENDEISYLSGCVEERKIIFQTK
ncbi:MAG: YaaA family protein [Mycoplasmatales bacterium]